MAPLYGHRRAVQLQVGSGAKCCREAVLHRRTTSWEAEYVTLFGLFLQQPPRLGLTSTFRLFSLGQAQWRLQWSLVTGLHKVTDADTEALREQPQGLQRWITEAPLQLGEESWRNDVAGSVDLRDPPDPPSPTYIGANKSSESVEIHVASPTRAILLMEPIKRTILVDRRRNRSDSFGEYSCRRGEL